MASDDLLRLRRMTGEDDVSKYTNADMQNFIDDAGGNLNKAAAVIWGEKASSYADLVNITEAGSSRSNSDLFDHADKLRRMYQGLVDDEETPVAGVGSSTTRAIVRP